MAPEDNPADDDPHGECRQEIQRLRESAEKVRLLLEPLRNHIYPSLTVIREALDILRRMQ